MESPGSSSIEASLVSLAACLLLAAPREAAAGDEPPFGLEKRTPWTASRLEGSPEPPLPYTVARTFTHLEIKAPLYIAREPGTDRLLIVQAGGEKERPSRILRVADD